jgi:hypothetical protein
MDDIIKKMCNQLSESYYGVNKKNLFEQPEGAVPSAPEDTTTSSSNDKETPKNNNENIKKFSPDNEYLKTFTTEMTSYISSGGANTFSLTFNDLTFDKSMKRVVWSGKYENKIEWKVIFQKNSEASGAYFNIANEKLSGEQTKTLNLINIYLTETFLNKISKAIDDKTLESQQTN